MYACTLYPRRQLEEKLFVLKHLEIPLSHTVNLFMCVYINGVMEAERFSEMEFYSTLTQLIAQEDFSVSLYGLPKIHKLP
jgi:hypothetical protein